MIPVERIVARVLAEHIDGPCDDPRCHLYRRHGVGPLCEHLAAEIAAALRADEGLVETMAEAMIRAGGWKDEPVMQGDRRVARAALDAITGSTDA